jgi:hypothetical protein
MFDCSSEISGFYKNHVRLSKTQVEELANYRETNKTRVENGLKNAECPLPVRHINQGSYAMKTINQHPANDYDIDIGVVFKKEDLKGPQGADKTALDARKMVCDALQDQRFKKQPEVRQNCVRVYYDEGHHVDMPIYREYEDENGKTIIELASTDWKASDPEAVTRWFNQAVIDKSPDETNGRQMRRIVRLLKFWCKSRGSWNMPTGFIISKLVDESYVSAENRNDQSLYDTMLRIKNRLVLNLDVYHPILIREKISEGKETAMQELKDRLDTAIDNLANLLDDDCTKQTALKAWKKFFNHSYFEDAVKNASAAGAVAPVYIAKKEPTRPVQREGESRFG